MAVSNRHAFFGIFPAESGLPGRPHYGPEAGEVGLSPREDELLRLVGRAGRGEGEALEELARQVRPLMSAWARAACPERSEAEDVLQESILEFHRSLAGLRDGRALLPWLRRLVRNNAADSHRRRSRLREVPLEAAAGRGLPRAAAGAGLDLAERAGLLLAALGELAEEDREMLTLRHEAGLSLEEIAEAAGSSPRAVESRLFRARRALRKKLAGRIEL